MTADGLKTRNGSTL